MPSLTIRIHLLRQHGKPTFTSIRRCVCSILCHASAAPRHFPTFLQNIHDFPNFPLALSQPVTMSWQFRMKYKTGFMPSKQRKPSNLGMKQPIKQSSTQQVVQECFTQSQTPLSPRASSTAPPFRRSRERAPSPLRPSCRPVAEYIAKPPSPRPSALP